MIELHDITQHYGVRPVLRSIDLRIERGELVVLLGPNGMGKSTLLGVMGGVLAPQRGTVSIDGMLRRSSNEIEQAIRRRAVYLPDKPWLPGSRTGREYLLAVGRLYAIPDDRLFEHAERLLTLFDLTPNADAPIRGYSAGQQKKLAVSGALIAEPEVMLLDEPFSGGLDPAGLLALKRVLRRRVTHDKATVVLTSPVPELVEEIADRVVILKEGSILAFDSIENLRRQANHRGTLGQVLERLFYPETVRNLETYFQELP